MLQINSEPPEAARFPPLPPCRGKVGMGVELWVSQASTPSLMKLLAIRLSYQKTIAKSLVIALPLQGGGNFKLNGHRIRTQHLHKRSNLFQFVQCSSHPGIVLMTFDVHVEHIFPKP